MLHSEQTKKIYNQTKINHNKTTSTVYVAKTKHPASATQDILGKCSHSQQQQQYYRYKLCGPIRLYWHTTYIS